MHMSRGKTVPKTLEIDPELRIFRKTCPYDAGINPARISGRIPILRRRCVLMEYITLGLTGLKVSRLALGCMTFGSPSWAPWVLGPHDARPIIFKALELGINFFDTADMYSLGASEEVLREALAD